jgi:hypothetical protein
MIRLVFGQMWIWRPERASLRLATRTEAEEIGNLFRRIGRKVEAKGFVGVLGHSASLLGEI